MRHWVPLRSLAPLALAAAFGSCGEARGSGPAHFFDLTENLHHRLKSRTFLPDREPLVFEIVADDEASPSDAFVLLRTELGTLGVRSNRSANVVMYMDQSTAFSHIVISTESAQRSIMTHFPMAPVHPLTSRVKLRMGNTR